MEKQRIYDKNKQKTLTDADKLALCTLLVKAGYTVRQGRENVGTATKPRYEYFIEFWEGEK